MNLQAIINRQENVFYDGHWHRSSNESELLKVTNPTNDEVFAEIPASKAEDVSMAIAAATKAYPDWRKLSGQQRAEYLNSFAKGLTSRFGGLVELQMINNGKPKHEAEIDVNDAIATFEYYAGLAESLDVQQGEVVRLPDETLNGKTRYEPIGPAGMIVPWNFPLVTSAWKIAPALAAGCTAVMKNSEVTPLIELVYGDIAQEINLPAGVLNILTGAVEAGVALTGDERLRKISFTGSNMVGAKVMEAVSPRCLPISLELGGKSPIVVFADAEVEQAVECIMAGVFYNCGQMCSATSRLIVAEQIAPQVFDLLAERTSNLRIGSSLQEMEIDMGPITVKAQFDKINGYFENARKDRLKCLIGGESISDQGGYFVKPTVYIDVPTDNSIWMDEIFGPVLAAKTFKDEEHAIQLANDSEYALVATIISQDLDKAQWAAAQIDGGHVWINSLQIIYPNTAWGGFKASGIGRELGPWGLNSYLGIKHLTIKQ